jgi:hypothetical protein
MEKTLYAIFAAVVIVLFLEHVAPRIGYEPAPQISTLAYQ